MPWGFHVKLARSVNMKRSILRALSLCLATAVAAGYAQAQNTSDRSSGSTTQTQPATPGTSSGIYSPGTQTSSSSSSTAGQSVRLSKLMNSSLKGQTGESLGQIQDIIVDPTSG